MELSLKDLKELLGNDEHKSRYALKVGSKYLFRTVTMIYTGELLDETKEYFAVINAAWIADSGRWADNLVSCSFNEVEPYPDDKVVLIYKSGMLDVVNIDNLPRKQK
jgi:hypothetical protein